MTAFDESKHSRATDGKFAHKPHSEAGSVSLAPARMKSSRHAGPGQSEGWFNREGNLHREGGPAATWLGGSQAFYRDGDLHRDPSEGPALTWRDGHSEYWVHGERIADPNPTEPEPFTPPHPLSTTDAVAWETARRPYGNPDTLARLTSHDHHLVRAAVASNKGTRPSDLTRLAKDVNVVVRANTAANEHTPTATLTDLMEDHDSLVRVQASRNPNTSLDALTIAYQADPDKRVRDAAYKRIAKSTLPDTD